MHQVAEPKRGGMVVGPGHNPDGSPGGGVPFVLEDTGKHIEEEGFEINIPNELRDLPGMHTFHGKNIEVLNQILALADPPLSITDKVQNVRSRDIVICVRSAWDDTERDFIGTIEEILHQINTSKGCKAIPNSKPQAPSPKFQETAKEGGEIAILNAKGGYNYSGEDKVTAKRCGLMTLPTTIPGTNCGNCIFFSSGFCDHSKVLLPVTSRQCCQFWDDKSFRSHLTNIWQADFFADRSMQYPLNKEGGYDYTGKALDRAREADLITLPEDIKGTNCADTNCMYGKKGLCVHPRIMLPITDRMSCAWWDNTDVKRPWGAPVEIEFLGEGGPIHSKARKKDWQAEYPNSPRWKKKKESLQELSNSIHRLRLKVGKDIGSEDERTALTALVVAIMDRSAERIGNDDSADNGHFGVTGFRKDHIRVVGNKVHLDYVGKSGTKHDKSISDLRISKALKKAIKNAPGDFIFETSDGFRVKCDKVNRYLEQFNISAKDLRGYNANKWIIEELKRSKVTSEDPEKAKKERKKIFNKAVKQVADRVGHGAATLKKHYMIPELPIQYIQHGRIIDMKNIGYYLDGGPLGDLRVEDYFANKNEVPDAVHKKIEEIHKESEEEGIDKVFNAREVKTVAWEDVVPTQDFLRSSKFAKVEALDDIYSINLPWAIEYQGKYYINDGHHRAVEMHKRNLPIKLHVYPVETILAKGGDINSEAGAPVLLSFADDAALLLLDNGGNINEKSKINNMKKITVLYNFNHPKMGFQNSITVDAKDNEDAIQKAEKAVSETYGSNMLKRFSFKVPEKLAQGAVVSGKIPMKEILIHWAEGDNSKYDKFPKTYSSWKKANNALKPVVAPEGEGYNKAKFTVTFSDGEKYDGRLDLSQKEDNANLTDNVVGNHINDYLKYTLQDDRTSEESKKEIREWLKKYDLGLPPAKIYDLPKYMLNKEGGITGIYENGSSVEEESTISDDEDEKPATCICFSSFLKESHPDLPEKLMQEDVNSNPELRKEVDAAYQAWGGGSMPKSKRKK